MVNNKNIRLVHASKVECFKSKVVCLKLLTPFRLFQHRHGNGVAPCRSCCSVFSRVAAVHLGVLPCDVTITANAAGMRGWNPAARLEATPALLRHVLIGFAFDVCVVGPFGAVGVAWNPRGSATFAQSGFACFAGPAAHQTTWVIEPYPSEKCERHLG